MIRQSLLPNEIETCGSNLYATPLLRKYTLHKSDLVKCITLSRIRLNGHWGVKKFHRGAVAFILTGIQECYVQTPGMPMLIVFCVTRYIIANDSIFYKVAVTINSQSEAINVTVATTMALVAAYCLFLARA